VVVQKVGGPQQYIADGRRGKIWACQFMGNPAARAAGIPIPQIHCSHPPYTAGLHARHSGNPHRPQLFSWAVSKLILGQITGQTELLIFLILGWGTNKDLVVSRIGVDIVVFPISLHQRHFIWRERLQLFLPLRSVSDDGSEARSREQVLCVLRI
jgi:hypothetical protein